MSKTLPLCLLFVLGCTNEEAKDQDPTQPEDGRDAGGATHTGTDAGPEDPENPEPTGSPLGAAVAWVSTDHKELWLKVKPTFEGDVSAYRAKGACGVTRTFFELPHLPQGKDYVFLIHEEGGCAPGSYTFDFDYYPAGSETVHAASVTLEATTEVWPGASILSSVEGSVSPTSGDTRYSVDAAKALTIYQVRLYDEEGNFETSCVVFDGISVPAGSSLFDACSAPPNAGTYRAVFRGYETATESPYFQSLLFHLDR
jgi:hypothetical protein